MFAKYYLIKITGKDPRRFLQNLYKMHITLENIELHKDCCFVKVSEAGFKKISKIKTSYQIEVVDRFSLAKIEYIVRKNYVFLLSIIVSLLVLFVLSKMIFQVEIVHSDQNICAMLEEELASYGISPFHFQVSFARQEKIASQILKDHKQDLEWLEIERTGTKYTVKVEQRKIKEIKEDTTPQNIVAKKDGIILKIDASTGEVVKKKNDYVKKGDVIITGVIKNQDEVKTQVHAEGQVFAETWYRVKVDMPLAYYDSKLTGNEKKVLSFYFLSKEFTIPSTYESKVVEEIFGFHNLMLPIGLSYRKEKERIITDLNLSFEEAVSLALAKGREKLKKKLGDEDEIILEKTLKTETFDSRITVEVFYKVKEDITATGEIVLEEEIPQEE